MACGCSKKNLPNGGNNNMNRNAAGSRLAFNPTDFVSRYYYGEPTSYTGKSTGIVYQPRQVGTLVLVHSEDAIADPEVFTETERRASTRRRRTEVTEPEVTEPEVTEPEVTEPEVTEPELETNTAPDSPTQEDTENAV